MCILSEEGLMEKEARAIYGGRVCDKGEDLRHIDSIVTAKLSAIQAWRMESVCCLLSLIDCLAQLIGVPTVILCWNLLLQRNPNAACTSSITHTFLNRRSATRRVAKSLLQSDWRYRQLCTIIYLVTQSWGKTGNLTFHNSHCLTVLHLLSADFLCPEYCGCVFIRPKGFNRLQHTHELNPLATVPNIMG